VGQPTGDLFVGVFATREVTSISVFSRPEGIGQPGDRTFPKIVNDMRIKTLAVENIDEFIDIVRSGLVLASK
jgi:hypothetical protein